MSAAAKSVSPRRLGIVFVALLVVAAATSAPAVDDQRVIILGYLSESSWIPSCACSTAALQARGLGKVHLLSDGARVLNREGEALVVGRLRKRDTPILIDVDYMLTFEFVEPSPVAWLARLRERPVLALVLLVLLANYGWSFVSSCTAWATACAQACLVALILDFVSMKFGISLTDLTWTLMLTASLLAGRKIADKFGSALHGKVKSAAVSLILGLLFGDLGGLLGGIGGAAVPLLSRRLALVFLNIALASVAFHLPDVTLKVSAAAVFVVACVDYWRSRALDSVSQPSVSPGQVTEPS
jgi:hypothetical protein